MSNRNVVLYKILTGSFIVIFLLMLFVIDPDSQMNIFFMKGKRVFSDYFNVLMYISDNNPYFNTLNGCGEKVYLPIAYLFMKLFTFGVDYNNMAMPDCLSNTTSLISFIVFTSFSLLVFIHAISKLTKNNSFWLLITIFISSVFFFTIERGNLTLLCGAFICYFFSYKNSSSVVLRRWAIISLCLAAILKVYPALFGLFLLQEKRYKEIGFCICFCLILAILPFLFFENGFDNIPQLISNLGENSAKRGYSYIFPRYSFSSTVYFFTSVIKLPDIIVSILANSARLLVFLFSILSIYAFWVTKSFWKKVALLSFIVLELPVNSAVYCGIYLIPMIFYMFDTKEASKLDLYYVIGVSLILCPFQLVIRISSLTSHISNMAVITMWALLLFEAFATKFGRLEKIS